MKEISLSKSLVLIRIVSKLKPFQINSHPCEEVEELLPFTSCPLGGRAESLSATAFSKEGGGQTYS